MSASVATLCTLGATRLIVVLPRRVVAEQLEAETDGVCEVTHGGDTTLEAVDDAIVEVVDEGRRSKRSEPLLGAWRVGNDDMPWCETCRIEPAERDSRESRGHRSFLGLDQ
jgi:hypothetical protein